MPDLDLDALLNELDVQDVQDVQDKEERDVPLIMEDANNNAYDSPKDIHVERTFEDKSHTNKSIDANKPEVVYSEDMLEVMDDTKAYIRDLFDLESQIADLKEDIKVRKEEAKELGVKVGNAAKAVRELIKEAKETSDEAKGVEEMKRLIKEDDNLYSQLVAKTTK